MSSRAAWLGSLALAACYSPYEPACGFLCGPDGACPSDFSCASDGVCHRDGSPEGMDCPRPSEFDVLGATAIRSVAVSITFSDPPNAMQAQDLMNYAIPGLSLTGESMLAGTTITLGTAPQTATSYTVTVANVSRFMDAEGLTTATATFTGRPPFDVAGAASTGSMEMTVTFDAPPDATSATDLASYDVLGLTLSAPSLVGSTVTLATSAQAATDYTITVSNVKRAADGEPLAANAADFTGMP